jgi:hypothetical protein
MQSLNMTQYPIYQQGIAQLLPLCSILSFSVCPVASPPLKMYFLLHK